MKDIVYYVVVFNEYDIEIGRIRCDTLERARELCRVIDNSEHFGTFIIA